MTLNSDLLRRSWREWITSDIDRSSPEWLQWLWTLVLALLIALGFTLFGIALSASIDPGPDPGRWLDLALWWRAYRVNLAISLTIAVLIHLLFLVIIPLVGKRRIRRFPNGGRAAFFVAIPLSGVAIGWPLGVWLVGHDMARWTRTMNAGEMLSSGILVLLISFILFLVFNARAQQAVAEKRATEAQLRLLQGQMEPHFLFNTLANVQALIEYEPVRARQVLESFTDYLRASLGGLRRDRSTVGDEIDLARSYLDLVGARMADRLTFSVDCPEALRQLPVPSFLLQPLVENAVHHGLEPKVDGGRVEIQVHRDGTALVLTVRDDGLGLNAPPRPGARAGNGVALENLRQRLRAAYGSDARVDLRDGAPGVIVTVRLRVDPPTS